jgi:Protein of unknown function (DUF1569)
VDTHLKKLRREIAAACAALTGEESTWHPPGKWSASEIFEHLYLTITGTTKGFQRLAAAGKQQLTRSTWKQRASRIVVLGFGYLPSVREAPKFARPRGLPPEHVIKEIDAKIAEMDAVIAICEEKMGRGMLLEHPFLGPLSGAQWRKFHLLHGRHHLRQIRALKKGIVGRRPSDS